MNGSVDKDRLAKALSVVERAVASRTSMPVLSNVLLDLQGDRLKVSATNMEISLVCWIEAEVDKAGSITIPARLLKDFVNGLPQGDILLSLDERTQSLNVRCGRYEANMKGIPADGYPLINDNSDVPVSLALPVAGLRSAIDKVALSASSDDNRPTLTGIEVKILSQDEGKILQLAATDGYRLSVYTISLGNSDWEDLSVIVPARTMSELGRISPDLGDDASVGVTIAPSKNQIVFEMAGGEKSLLIGAQVIGQLIDARFPDWKATVPKEWGTRVILDTPSFLKAVRIVQMFARENNYISNLQIVPGVETGKLSISATSGEADNTSELDAEVEGEEIGISFNVKFLIEYLSQVKSPTVALELTKSTRPGRLYSPGENENGCYYVIMPMHPPR